MGGTLIIFTSMAAFKTSTTTSAHSALHWAFTDPEMLFIISAFLFTVSLMLVAFLVSCLYLDVYWSKESRRLLEEEEGKRKKRRAVAAAVLYAILDAASKAKSDDDDEEPVGESECPNCPTHLTDSVSEKVTPEEPEEVVKDGEDDKPGSVSEVERVELKDEDNNNKKKKTKKRLRKKRNDPNGGQEEEKAAVAAMAAEESVLEFPFATASSGIQRKIKEQFDQIVKFHQSNCLTITQIEHFTNFLLEVKKELQHRSEAIQRRFKITKALTVKADRSSRDRLRQQVSRIELEQNRLVEDALVYNQVQQHLKHSPAYHKMLKVCACPETEAKTVKDVDSSDNDVGDISFEELLAQEKKDAFWQNFRISKG